MVLLGPRIHFYEINDQAWFPSYFRSKVQDCLTLMWTLRLPPIQPTSPASLVATTFQRVLGPSVQNYTYVDFAAGAGGPTPYIEHELNRRLQPTLKQQPQNHLTNGYHNQDTDSDTGVDFVLTDLHPHLEAWSAASHKSIHLHYISTPIDGGSAPPNLLSLANLRTDKKVFRTFHLAFHHFPDAVALRILQNTLRTSSAFGIFELQERTLSSLFTVTMMWPLLLLVTPWYFWRSPGHLFFTYVVPIIPFVLVFDGWVSSMRTRSEWELMRMVQKLGREADGWRFEGGREVHTWPTGHMSYFVGSKEE